ncbi:hypothetical protein NPIL_688951, partial [Nephila pilipes]
MVCSAGADERCLTAPREGLTDYDKEICLLRTPVCSGVTKGYARVAVTLAEAIDLK